MRRNLLGELGQFCSVACPSELPEGIFGKSTWTGGLETALELLYLIKIMVETIARRV